MQGYNADDEMFVIEEIRLGDDYGSDPFLYELFNKTLADSFINQLSSAYFPQKPPTFSTPIYTPTPQNNTQQPSIASNTQLLGEAYHSQPIANEYGNFHIDDDHLNLNENQEMHQLDSTQNSEVNEPIPISSPQPQITYFQMLKKDQLRNGYGLTLRQSHLSLDDPKNLRVLKKICTKQCKRFGDKTISAEDIRLLDINKRNLTIQNGQGASYFYVEGADQKDNLMRYIYGKYFIWYGRNRYALDVLKNKRIKQNKRTVYFQVMSTFIQQVPHILQIFQNQNNPLGITLG